MKRRTLNSVKWSLLDTYASYGLKFVFAVAITRILTPHDYGIVAYTGFFIAIATWLSEGGFGAALIQKKDADQVDYSTAWHFNIGVSVVFFVIYFLSSKTIANYFQEPALKWVIRVTSLNLLANSICYIHLIKLIKAIHFRPQAIINVSSSVISGTVGILLALAGKGYWALILMTLSGSIFRMAGYLWVTKWRPSLIFNIQSFREQFRFGSKVFIQGLLESTFREIYSLVIGKTYNTNSLGYYSRGFKFYELLVVQTGIAFNKVLFPTMAGRISDPSYHHNSYFRFYNMLFFLFAPFSLFLILFSKPIVIGMLTRKWLGAVPYMQLCCAGGFIFMLIYFNSSTILSLNHPKICLKLDVIQKTLLLMALIITYNIGIKAIIIGWLIVYYVYYFIYEWYMFRIGLSNGDKYINMLKVIIAIVPSVIIYFGIRYMFNETIITAVLQIVLLPIAYLYAAYMFRISSYKDFYKIIESYLPNKKRNINKE